MSAHVVTVGSRAGHGELAVFVDYDFKAASTTPEKVAAEYVRRIAPGGEWQAVNVRDVAQVGEVRAAR